MKRKITSSTSIVLQAVKSVSALEKPFYAINWFNTRFSWLYELYNYLAVKIVFNIGGRVFFKAHLSETLIGEESASRAVLLIVNYPSGGAFLDMMTKRSFQFVSLLRMLAVKDFSFVMQQRIDGPALLVERTQEYQSDRVYALHYFRSETSFPDSVKELNDLLLDSGVRFHFGGEKVITLAIEGKNGETKPINFITDQVILLEADDQSALKELILSVAYQKFAGDLNGSYVGMMNRVM